MICERSVSRTVLNASTLMACLLHYKQCTPLTLSLLPFDHVSKNFIIRYNLFRIFTYSRTPERAFFCCYFQPNNFSCQTFSASLHSTLHFISNLRVLSWFVFVTRSGIISLSWVKLTSASVAISLADQYQAWSKCERLIEHSQPESSYSITTKPSTSPLCVSPRELSGRTNEPFRYHPSKHSWGAQECDSVLNALVCDPLLKKTFVSSLKAAACTR